MEEQLKTKQISKHAFAAVIEQLRSARMLYYVASLVHHSKETKAKESNPALVLARASILFNSPAFLLEACNIAPRQFNYSDRNTDIRTVPCVVIEGRRRLKHKSEQFAVPVDFLPEIAQQYYTPPIVVGDLAR